MFKYYLFNKPRGCVSARRDTLHMTVMDYFPEYMRDTFSPVGRLDIDTVGLLIITNDGKYIHKMTMPEYKVEKTYFFMAFGDISKESAKRIENGVTLVGKGIVTRPAKLEILSHGRVGDAGDFMVSKKRSQYLKNPNGKTVTGKITVTEGKKHEVKRILKAVGCHIFYLKRESEGNLVLPSDLKEGQYMEIVI